MMINRLSDLWTKTSALFPDINPYDVRIMPYGDYTVTVGEEEEQVPGSYPWTITLANDSYLLNNNIFIRQWVVVDSEIDSWLERFREKFSQEVTDYNNEYLELLMDENID